MSKILIELAKQANLKGQSETDLSPAEHEFARLILKECVNILSNKKTYNACVLTTFDHGLAQCVTENSIRAICDNFNIKIN